MKNLRPMNRIQQQSGRANRKSKNTMTLRDYGGDIEKLENLLKRVLSEGVLRAALEMEIRTTLEEMNIKP